MADATELADTTTSESPEDAAQEEEEAVALPARDMALTGAPFGPLFFMGAFPRQVKESCAGPDDTQVVLLDLSDGATLDLCHVIELSLDWICLAVFREAPVSCDLMDVVFLPYDRISRITVSRRSPVERSIGFDLGRSASALSPGPTHLPVPEEESK